MNLDFLFEGRAADLVPLKRSRMAESAYAFFRGSAALFYRDLPKDLRKDPSPHAWLCGDAHPENLGSFKNALRQTYFDFNDFDEACAGPLGRDLARYCTGVLLAHDRVKPARAFLGAYAEALAAGKSYHLDIATSSGSILRLLEEVDRRDHDAFLAKHCQGECIRLRDGRTLVLDTTQKRSLSAALADWARTTEHPGHYRVIDIARRVAGNGSLGWPRYMVLVRGRKKPFFLDLKLAVPSAAAERLPGAATWPSEAHRVVELQTRLQYSPADLLQVLEYSGQHYVLRELQSGESRVKVEDLSPDELDEFHASAGRLLAWAHLRASGFRGASTVDAMMEFGRDLEPETYLEAAQKLATRMRGYHRDFVP